jgi:benzil reductase ((S)-benzoin forming)
MRAAIVTGVSRGLGEALASKLLERGYYVLGIGRASGARLSGANYLFIEFDLAQSANVASVLKAPLAQLAAKRPEYVCLINNAAVGTPVGILGTLDAGEIAGALAVNLAAPIALANLFCQVFADDAIERRIINVSSGAASNAMPGIANYCVAKAGLEMLTHALAAERDGDRFRAITVRPGIIDTGMQEYMRSRPKEVLPDVALFEGYHKGGELVPPDTTAKAIVDKLVVDAVEHGRTYTYQEIAG